MSFACGNRRGGTDRRKPSGTVLDRPAEPDTPGHFSTRGAPCRLDGHVGWPCGARREARMPKTTSSRAAQRLCHRRPRDALGAGEFGAGRVHPIVEQAPPAGDLLLPVVPDLLHRPLRSPPTAPTPCLPRRCRQPGEPASVDRGRLSSESIGEPKTHRARNRGSSDPGSVPACCSGPQLRGPTLFTSPVSPPSFPLPRTPPQHLR